MQTPPATTSASFAPEVRSGLVLGRYELLIPIAAGGMAQVWAARLRGARQFQKIVAIKTMLPQLSDDAQFEQMFLDEARLASGVRHPNAVEILDLGDQNGILYLVMEWIEGVPLNQLMKRAKKNGGIPVAIAARIAQQACAGLHAAHELKDETGQLVGLVHRDVSPQNLLVTYAGVTKVVDFGVAKATALGGEATQAGQVKGKVSYMAPEQVNGEGLDRRADVFALGIVLYALTTGKHPFRRESEAATMYNICSPESVVPPSSVVENYDPDLEPIVLKALAKNRDDRYESCDAMFRALNNLPEHLRLDSDADVGAYILELHSERRAEQRKLLEDAIVRADAEPSGAWSSTGVTNGRSSINSLTGTGDLSGVGSGLHPHANRNRWIGIAGLVALALSGAAMTVMILTRNTPLPPPPPRIIEVPVPVEVPLAAPARAEEDALDLENLEEEAEAADTKRKAEEAARRARDLARKRRKQQQANPPPQKVEKNWKHNPGF